MKKIQFFFGLITVLFLFWAGTASATVIYDQQVDFDNQGAHFSDDPTYTVYDNFTLSSAASVNTATVWGSFWSSGQVPDPLTFNLSFHTDTTWANPIFESVASVISFTNTGYFHNNTQSAPIYKIVLDLGSSINLSADQEYWFGAQAINTLSSSFAWQNSVIVDNYYYQNSSRQSEDVAFNLINRDVVPEPTTMMLLGFGLIGIAGVSRKKQ